MKECAICSNTNNTTQEPAVLFIGAQGTKYIVCPDCEKKLDRFLSAASPTEKESVKNEITQELQHNENATNNVELYHFMSKMLNETDQNNFEGVEETNFSYEENTNKTDLEIHHPKIEFSGEVSDKTRKYILLRDFKLNLLVDAAFSAIVLPFAFLLNSFFPTAIYYAIPFLLFACVFFTLPPPKKEQSNMLPTSIVIEYGTMVVTTPTQKIIKSVNDVKKVLDFGHLYQILFVPSEKTQLFVCQKDLLITGTLDDFEELFLNKIVKSKKSQSST